ncbi:ADP-ribosylglycohydrolase family protein [Streptomyces sp. NPDC052301]|uniref:ADP-ribosylglycohydrolase family protein n=1 Tax=Streptomyces sp. NPDC052301 TaxID=3365687 RepID=UPI0037D31CE9
MADGKDEKAARRNALRTESRMRGMLLGLALGDTVGTTRGRLPTSGPLRAGVSTQLACFTTEGVIRAFVRGEHKGICHPPGVALHAYCRWAALQGIEVARMRRRWGSHMSERAWPDGWLAKVPALAERRGSAPATVAALSRVGDPHESTATPSRGSHALTRTLPVAFAGLPGVRQAGEFAGLTHGDRAARSVAVLGTLLVHHCLTTPPPEHVPGAAGPADRAVREAVEAAVAAVPDVVRRTMEESGPTTPGGGSADGIAAAAAEEQRWLREGYRYAVEQPAQPALLARLAPDATAPSALLGGLYAAVSFPGRQQITAALEFAAGAPDGPAVACVTGALLGAVHGAEALPADRVSRHELAWILDTLARDMLAQIDDSPSGSEYVQGWDPYWWDRYPGW